MMFSFLLCGFCVATASVAVAQRPTVAMDRAVLHERARIAISSSRSATTQAAMDACTRWMAEYPYDASVLRAWRTDASTRLERVLLDDANLMLAAGRTLDARRGAARLGNVPWGRAVAGRTQFVSGSP